jgi:hypothetical protein
VGNGAKSIFSKGSMNTFRDHLQDTLKQQGGILQTVGKGMSGASPSYVRGVHFIPELIPVFAGLGHRGSYWSGSARVQRWQPPVPVSYKGNKLKVAGNVVNQIEKASKSGSKIASFA